jgi:hypothetical protein
MKYLIYPALLGLALTSCSQSRQEAVTAPAPTTELLVTSAPLTPPATPESVPFAPKPQPDRAIIYHGELDLAVDDFDQASTSIDQLLQQHHSYLNTARETRANGQHRQEMTLKVPPAEFLPLVAALGKLGRIDNKDVASSDVTADVLEATNTLSAQQSATTKAQAQLTHAANPAEANRLTEEVRQLQQEQAAAQAKLRQLGAASAWATLTLRYFQDLPTPAPPAPTADFIPRFLTSFYWGWSLVLGVIVVFTNVWPLLLLSAAGWWAVRRWHRQQVMPD